MRKILVVAPHADDETLGCGGALLKFKKEKNKLFWLLVTTMAPESGYGAAQINKRAQEIKRVATAYGFQKTFQLRFPASKLDVTPLAELASAMGHVVREVRPEVVLVPFLGDAHTDHQITFKAMASCFKWFRYPSIKKVLAYETLSETDQAVPKKGTSFVPQVFVDITPYLTSKVRIMKIYKSEVGKFPFPRSTKAIKALASVRGAACGSQAAEAFMLIKEIF